MILGALRVIALAEDATQGGARSPARARCKFVLPTLLATTALVAVTAFASGAAKAADATWLQTPTSDNFNTAANWSPATVPTGGTAFFGTSNQTALTFSLDTLADGWTFNSGASAYTFTNNHALVFDGAGIVINGGSATITNDDAVFFNGASSTAGNATINNVSFGTLNFNFNSTAGNATITNTNNVFFESASTAGNATITNTHNVFFSGASTGGNAAITNVSSGAVVDFSGSIGPADNHKLTAGSIAGAGSFLLGRNELTVGGNDMSTDVSGVISGLGGSLVKVGTGTLTLSGPNTYTGGTTINAGTLQLGDGGVLGNGSIIGNVVDNGTLAFDHINGFTFGGVISGAGGLAQIGSGTTILTANNSYTGPTTITRGVLQAGAPISAFGSNSAVTINAGTLALNNFNETIGSLAGASGASVTLGSGTLSVGGDNTSTAYAGAIIGTGGLDKVGAGTPDALGPRQFGRNNHRRRHARR